MTRTFFFCMVFITALVVSTLPGYSAGVPKDPNRLSPRSHDPVPCALQLPGDADGSGIIMLSDAAFIFDFLEGTGPAPVPMQNGDPNGDCCVNDADADYILAFIFAGGPAPVACTCIDFHDPGDADGSGISDITDAVYLIQWIFQGGIPPCDTGYPMGCGDADGSGVSDISDAVFLIQWIFQGGPAPQCQLFETSALLDC